MPLTSLVGREREVEQVKELLFSWKVRLLTLTGPGGVGKTRLALQVAASLHGSFSGGAYFVSLAPISNHDLVLPTIAETLGVRETSGQSFLSTLCAALAGKHMLLVLDNFEQLLGVGGEDAATAQVLELLLCTSGLQVLVTSRAPLHLYGEHEYQVSPLSLPDAATLSSLENLTQYEAVRLFIERARAARQGFMVNNDNAPAVAEICHRLDGLPLAIELAAARVKLMSPQALLKRLDHGRRLTTLTGGPVNLPLRHRTLHAAIAWSYNLLNEEEQRLLRSLAVFVGGCTLEAAEAICLGDGAIESTSLPGPSSYASLDALAALADKSLLRQSEQDDGEPRFHMLETIREFALEQLTASAEAREVERKHTDFFLALAEEAEPNMMGADQGVWLERLAPEHDNMRAVLLRAQKAGDGETGLRLGAALYHFWYIRGFLSEGRRWLSEALAHVGDASTRTRARSLNRLGSLCSLQGDYETGSQYHKQSLALWRELGYKPGIASVLGNLGSTAWQQGDYESAKRLREESIAIYRQIGPDWAVVVASGKYNLSVMAWAQGYNEEAYRLCEEALPLQREQGDTRGIANSLYTMGLVLADEGKFQAARANQEEALALSRELGDKVGIACSLQALGEIAADQGDYSNAHSFQSDALRLRYELGSKRTVADSLEGLAIVAREASDLRRMVLLFAAANALRAQIGASIVPRDRSRHEHWLDLAHARLGPAAFTEAWEEGKTLTLEEAMSLALEEPSAQRMATQTTFPPPTRSKPARRPTPEPGHDLTAREKEVLRLVAAGLSNPEIAEYLTLSIYTVQTHLRSIFSKIDVKSRAAAVRYVFEHSLS